MDTHMDDQVIAQVLAGDKNAYQAIVEQYQASLYRFCLSMVSQVQDAEDLTAEALIKAYTKLGDYRPNGQFKSWLFTIAYHTSLDFIRRHKRRPRTHLDAVPEIQDQAPGPLDHSLEKARQRVLEEALAKLKPDQRAMISLYYYQDLSYDEIAATLHMSKGTVASKLHRSRSRLKEILKEGDYDAIS